jgi:L-alanine-DL-glutamate epimerase-like enolase superfamily enzyme
VKLRPGELRSDAELLRSLRRELGDGVALRADANQSLTQRLIDPQLADLRAVRLEWLEEPWPEAAQSPPPGLPLALDESLLLPGKGGLGGSGRGAVAALVLKPSLLGGLVATHAWLTAARLLGKAAVVSHQLEGPVGFQSAAALALAHTRAGPAQGLGAHPALAAFPRPAALARQGHALRYYQEPGLGVGLDSLRPFVQRVAGDAA